MKSGHPRACRLVVTVTVATVAVVGTTVVADMVVVVVVVHCARGNFEEQNDMAGG